MINKNKVIAILKNNAIEMFIYGCLKDFSDWKQAVECSFNAMYEGVMIGDQSYNMAAGEILDIVSAEYDKLCSLYTKEEYKPILQDYSKAISNYQKAYEALKNCGNPQLDICARMEYFKQYQGFDAEANNYNQAASSKADEGLNNSYKKIIA